MKRLILIFGLLVSHCPLIANESTFIISRHQNTEALTPCEEVVTLAYKELGINFVVKEYPGRRSLHMANSGQADAELCRIKLTEKRFNNLVPIEPAIHRLAFYAVTKDVSKPLTKVSALNGLRIGSIRGMMAAELIFENQNVRYENSAAQTARLLTNGSVDVLILSLPDIKKLIEDNLLNEEFVQPTPLYQLELYHFIHRKHQDKVAELSQIFRKLAIN